MNALVQSAAQDLDKVKAGIVETFYYDGKPFAMTLTRSGDLNEDWTKALEEAARPFRASGMTFNDIPVNQQRSILGRLCAEMIVLGWNEEHFQAPFSKQACEETFAAVPELLTFVLKVSSDSKKFARKEQLAIAGN